MLELLALLNRERAGVGVGPLRLDGRLSAAAVGHAGDLASGRVNLGDSHVGGEGSSIEERLRGAGYVPARWLECTGWGWPSAAAMVGWWMGSGVHRAAILSDRVSEVGIGYVERVGSLWGHYWVVDLAEPVGGQVADPPAPPAGAGGHVVLAPVVVAPGPAVGAGGVVLVDFLRGDGRVYMVRHPGGDEEKFRSVDLGGGRWLQLKNGQWEELWVADGFVWRGVDTSAGDGQFYRQWEDGRRGARWGPARLGVGESWVSPVEHSVQTFWKGDCSPAEHHRNGRARNRLELVGRYERVVMNGVVVEDVVELRTHTAESMLFGRGWGLVGWRAGWGSSEVVARLPLHEGDNLPEVGCFGP